MGQIGFVQGFLGGVIADEPRAALIGRDVLSAGGTAADAAIAVGFALSVTYPSTASLGGGGVCIVHDNRTKTTETLEFLASAPSAALPTSTRPSAVPALPRGLFALHSKYGRLRWTQLVIPAEQIARFGNPLSRALAVDLQPVGDALLQDVESRRVFFNAVTGGLVREGDRIVQVDLAAILNNIGRAGPGEFYAGPMAQQIVNAVRESGGSLSLDDLRAYSPRWRETVEIPYDNGILHFVPPPSAAGTVEAQMAAMLIEASSYERASAQDRPHLLIEAGKRAFAERDQWFTPANAGILQNDRVQAAYVRRLMSTYRADRATPATDLGMTGDPRPENPSATSVVVLDREGSAVACNFTMNNQFGIGRIARGTGIMLAAMPGQYGGGPMSLGPVLLVNHNSNKVFAAGVASGGATAPMALTQVMLDILLGKRSVDEAIAAKRVHHGGRPDLAFFEQGMDEALVRGLTGRGHRVAATPMIGRVNFAYCRNGVPTTSTSLQDICVMRSDPRAFGLSSSAAR